MMTDEALERKMPVGSSFVHIKIRIDNFTAFGIAQAHNPSD